MKNFASLLFLLFTISNSSQTNSLKKSPILSEAPANTVWMSDERLARIDAMCKEVIGHHVPSIVALVARKGKIVFLNAYGVADALGKVLKKDAIFRIASQTKAITATAVMMLWEEGKFKQLVGQSIDD